MKQVVIALVVAGCGSSQSRSSTSSPTPSPSTTVSTTAGSANGGPTDGGGAHGGDTDGSATHDIVQVTNSGVVGSVALTQGAAVASLTDPDDADTPRLEGAVGYGRSGIGHADSVVAMVTIGHAGVKGDLDKAIIHRYVKRNVQKLQYCYEKELLNDRKLQGTVTVEFVIGADGFVSSSIGSGLQPHVASCVAAVIKSIEFPKPHGGGNVNVTYPLTFTSGK